MEWLCRDYRLPLRSPPLVMGIVNVTPDSFSDGGRFLDAGAAIEQGLRLAAEGADLLDIGGESTRPGAHAVPEAEELRRVLPVIRALVAQTRVPLSIDTRKAAVAAAALQAGASLVNDVSGGRDPELLGVCARAGAGLVLMHMQGEPGTMQDAPHYAEVVEEVGAYLAARLAAAEAAGLPRAAVVVDPGLGFGKTVEHNLALLRALPRLAARAGGPGPPAPLLVGLSRKRFLGAITGRSDPAERLAASLAGALVAARGGARILRVHDVKETCDALKFAHTLESDVPA